MLDKLQRNLREWTWLFRYLALGCLFGSVYLLLLRPVKKQCMTAFREFPSHAASRDLAAMPRAAALGPGAKADPWKTSWELPDLGGRSIAEEACAAEESSGGEGQGRAGGSVAAGAELAA